MTKRIFALVLAVASLTLASPALAADTPTSTPTPTASATPTATTTATPTTTPGTHSTTTGGAHTLGKRTRLIHGIVKSVSGSGFVLTTERYGDVTVTLPTPATNREGKSHGRGPQTISAPSVSVGERVVVLGRTSADGKSFVARRVHVLGMRQNGAPRAAHLVGTVVSASATSITVKLADGTSQTVSVASDVKIKPDGKTVADLVSGTKVTVVTRDGAATGIVIAANS